MRVTVLTVGTTGDVLPFIALGRGLQRAGHEVRLATHAAYESTVRAHQMEFSPIDGDPRVVFAQARRRLGEQGGTASDSRPLAGLRHIRRSFQDIKPLLRQVLSDTSRAVAGAEAVICFPLLFVGQMIAERQGIPCAFAALWPVKRTAAFPPITLPPRLKLGPTGNLIAYSLATRAVWLAARPIVNWCRDELNLPQLSYRSVLRQLQGSDQVWLYGFSPNVVPRPADWGPRSHVTGYWFLERQMDWRPPDALQRFLDAGPPPVYVGFGSMPTGDPARAAALITRALRRSGKRGILAAGWSKLPRTSLPDDVYLLDSVPHDWLFPRMSMVVHHGGAGTTAAGLRAGIPNVVIPFYADQPFWGRRVHALGAGPPPIPWRRLTVEGLATAIADADAPATRARAATLGERVRAEDGVALAVQAFERDMAAAFLRR